MKKEAVPENEPIPGAFIAIQPKEETATEILDRFIIRVSFSQERIPYLDQEVKVNRTHIFVVRIQLTHKITLHMLPP